MFSDSKLKKGRQFYIHLNEIFILAYVKDSNTIISSETV